MRASTLACKSAGSQLRPQCLWTSRFTPCSRRIRGGKKTQSSRCCQGLTAPCQRLYLLAGLLVCGGCGRRMESAWSNGKPAYRCRHGHAIASTPGPGRAKNAYIREDRILPHLPALHLRLTGYATPQRRQRTRGGLDVRHRASPEDVIRYLRERQVTLTYAPASGALIAGTAETAQCWR